MKLSDFHYDFPKELIAQKPLKERDLARLLVLDKRGGTIEEKTFRDVAGYLKEGDCLVLNDTKVMPARLYGRRETGGKVEIFLLDSSGDKIRALVRPSKRIKDGETIDLDGGIKAVVLEKADVGRLVDFNAPIEEVMEYGHVPLPPYIDRQDNTSDRSDYQTVYASKAGATASPTAGLHFTEELLSGIKNRGISVAHVTLHTSYGTFAPVKEKNIEEHHMHSEYFQMDAEAAETINRTKDNGGRVFAVGTTSCRVLETVAAKDGRVRQAEGETNLFIYPGYKFKMIEGIITNFHLPESTLLMLVSAFAGREFIMEAYARAIDGKFRFFSYGDAMFIF
ncbi:MAG: tRNA preQ1(34) S-adenosylmethionine ribosyltransferase-isomerase QueA [Candidatus Tantalella remota]|nr:tRNA preQ1(34) S-adenosylmethionine ribosyltransferase-isomerase QueA [Candidatus Tantalella remota]